ncbi:hypothetical protein [Streptomyces prunicolor]|uniref:hypothetical protein n=1 Tax=Streptomyces prunicolor TaxID=67348 RepID=UPI0033E68578
MSADPSARPPAPAPAPTESERIAKEKRRLGMIREYWNQLCGIVHVRRENDGYDIARWQQATYLDASAEAEHHRYRAEAP